MTLTPVPAAAASAAPRPTARRRRPRISRSLRQRNRRVEAHRDLVRPLAIHYARCSRESREDLLQVGLLGLIRAAELYRTELTTPFEAFARPHIRGAILHYLRDSAPIVRLPRRQAELQERLLRRSAETAAEPGTAAAESLRLELRIGREQWNLLLRQRRLNRPCPLDGVLASGREGQMQTLDPSAEDPLQQDAFGQVEGAAGALRPSAEQLLARLEPRQRRVVREVVLQAASYRTVAAGMGVSPMTVQRLLRRGLEELRQVLDQDSDQLPVSG